MTDPFASHDPFASDEGDPFGDPKGIGNMPRMIELMGRLLLLTPKAIETVPNTLQPGTMQDRLTTDLVVLDGAFPIRRVNSKTEQPTDEEPLDSRTFERMWISNTAIVNACRASVAGKGPKMILGRLARSEKVEKGKNPAWILTLATPEDRVLARKWLAQQEPAF